MIDPPKRSFKVPVGIDPGLGETGVVILSPELDVLACSTWTAPKGNDLERCISLAGTVAAWVFQQVPEGKGAIEIGIETPVLTGSPVVFAKQWRFLSLLEYFLYVEANKLSRSVVIIEVTPTESKKALTGHGNADKEDMINYSPFTDAHNMRQSTKEACADAYGHSIAARKGFGGTPVSLDMIVPLRLKPCYVEDKK